MPKIGRPQKPYQSQFGPIAGLARDTDGRWRIVATGQKFREDNEAAAIARFRRICPSDSIFVPVSSSIDPCDNAQAGDEISAKSTLLEREDENGETEIGYHLD